MGAIDRKQLRRYGIPGASALALTLNAGCAGQAVSGQWEATLLRSFWELPMDQTGTTYYGDEVRRLMAVALDLEANGTGEYRYQQSTRWYGGYYDGERYERYVTEPVSWESTDRGRFLLSIGDDLELVCELRTDRLLCADEWTTATDFRRLGSP